MDAKDDVRLWPTNTFLMTTDEGHFEGVEAIVCGDGSQVWMSDSTRLQKWWYDFKRQGSQESVAEGRGTRMETREGDKGGEAGGEKEKNVVAVEED
jgi:hypothetical protein